MELPPSEVGDAPGSVGTMPFIVGITPVVGMVVSAAATDGCGDCDGPGVEVGKTLGAGDSDGAAEIVGEALSAAVGAPLGAGLAVGDIVMEQSACSMEEVMSGILKVSAVQLPSAHV